jgi:hypothetical protein
LHYPKIFDILFTEREVKKMAKSLNALATQIYNECLADGEPVTEEEALEMARMELNVKTAEIVDAGKEKGKARKPKTVKVSDEKKALFDSILKNLDRCVGVEPENVSVLTENKLIEVKIGAKTFKIDLVECRKPKK